MKKKAFLTSIAVLAATMALEVGAALPKPFTDQPVVKNDLTLTAPEGASRQAQFVLERPVSTGAASTKHSYHSSHSSHRSHSSHYSSRY